MNKEKSFDIKINIPDYALCIMERLWAAGEEAYIVGGSLRDALIGITPHDYDMTTSALPSKTAELFSDLRVIETGLKHGTITVISQGHPIEITTFRVDGSYLDSRHPDSVSFTRSVGEDLARRDFTVNAMAYDPRGALIDLFGGREDILKKRIKAVGEPHKRFEEDALRIMRAFRFSAQLGFEIEQGTLKAAFDCKERLENISRERIGSEFLRLICSKYPEKPLMQMIELGIMPFVIGELELDKRAVQLLNQMPDEDVARLGLLLVGKDAAVSRAALNLLKCSNKQKSGAVDVARGAIRKIESQEDAARLRADVGERDAFAVRASVLLGYSNESAIDIVDGNTAPSTVSELAIGGKELGEMGIKGREIGEILSYLLERVIKDPSLNTKDTLILLAKEKHNEKGE